MRVECEICKMEVITADESIKPGMWRIDLTQEDIDFKMGATICAFCAQEFIKLAAKLQEGR